MDETTEVFDTEGEAIAFTEGLDCAQNMLDSDHLTWDEPVVEADRWVVRVRFLV
jgi:hypothetical protein